MFESGEKNTYGSGEVSVLLTNFRSLLHFLWPPTQVPVLLAVVSSDGADTPLLKLLLMFSLNSNQKILEYELAHIFQSIREPQIGPWSIVLAPWPHILDKVLDLTSWG
jgi:hypothetical protein